MYRINRLPTNGGTINGTSKNRPNQRIAMEVKINEGNLIMSNILPNINHYK